MGFMEVLVASRRGDVNELGRRLITKVRSAPNTKQAPLAAHVRRGLNTDTCVAATSSALDPNVRFPVRHIASLHPDQRRYHLEVVLHAMLQFAKQDILVPRQLMILLVSGLITLPDARQRHEAKHWDALVAL